jgi:hypothetical protein
MVARLALASAVIDTIQDAKTEFEILVADLGAEYIVAEMGHVSTIMM